VTVNYTGWLFVDGKKGKKFDGSVATLKTETKEGPRGTGRPGLRPPDRIAGR